MLRLSLVLLLFCSPAFAEQAWPVARGPSREPAPFTFDAKSLDKVPRDFLDDAAAVVLYAGANYLVEKDGTIETVTHEITRLNGRKGIDKLGEFRNITFTPSHQKVTLHLARIHKPDGKIVEVSPRHVHLRDVATDYQVYDPEKQLIISFPTLAVGDVIEVKWTVTGKNPEHDGRFFTKYSFGDPSHPLMLDEMRVRLPKDVPLKHAIVHGKLKSSVAERDGYRLHTWSKGPIPAAPKDDDLPSREELRTGVIVSTFATWEQVGEWKHKIRSACWKCTPKIQKLVAEITKLCKTPLDKAKALTYWVRKNVRYVSVGEKHDYTPHLPEDVIANRYGDCKDTSQLLAVMLREAGLAVELATLGVLDDGQVHPEVPSPWGTHAILMTTIDGKQHWIDTTVRLGRWDELPKDDLDRLSYLTDDKGKVRLVRTPMQTADMTRTVQVTDVWIDPSGTSRCQRTMTTTGLAALVQRDRFLEVPEGERRRQVTAELQDANSRTRLIELRLDEKGLANLDAAVTVSSTFEIPRHFTGSTDREGSVTDSRVWGRLLSHNIDHDRKVPLVLPGPFESVHTFRFYVPAAFVADGLPRSKEVKSKWGTFEVKVKALDRDDIPRRIEITFVTRLEKARIEVDDLDGFRKFHEDINRDYRVWLTLKPATDLASTEMMEELLALSPQNALTASTLARIYLKSEKFDDARRVIERACYYTPAESGLWELLVQSSQTPAQEEQAQRELVKRFPENNEHGIALGRILVTQGKQDEARKVLVELTKSGSKVERASAHYQLARSYYRKDQPKEALAELDFASNLDVGTVSSLRAFMLRAQVLEDLKRPKDALGSYRLALALEPKRQDVLLALIRVALEVKDELAALDYLRRYTLVVDRDVPGLLLAADAYLGMNRHDDAFELAARAREIAFHEKAQRILGLVHLQRGEDDKAFFHLNKADPDSTVVLGMLKAAVNSAKLGDVETALEKAAKLGKPSEPLKQSMARSRALLQRRKDLDRLVTIPEGKASEFSSALDSLAFAESARAVGRPFEKRLAEAVKLEIGPALALRGRAELGRGKLAKALADAVRAIERSPNDAGGYYVRGKVRHERGQEGGLDDLRKAATLSNRRDADILLAYSEALEKAGKREEAIDAAKEALKIRPADAELSEHLAGLQKKG